MKIQLYRWSIFLLLFLLSLAPVSYSAAPVSTKEQWQQFQRLSPVEREALLRSLKGHAITTRDGEVSSVPEISGSLVDEIPANTPIDPGALQSPRLKSGDTILIDLWRKGSETSSTETSEKVFPEGHVSQTAIPEQKLFVLDQFGAVTLEKAGRIILKGLNEVEAADRIAAEPTLRKFQVTVKLLPVEEPLKPFGYDLFSAAPKTFASGTDIPIPVDYIVGPGDTVLVQLFGKENAEHELIITRNGEILFPSIGPVQVGGLTFLQLEQQIQNRVKKQLIGMKVSVTLGRLRSIRVFVLGDTERPGSYIVSGLSTLTNALFASGGVKRIGSLRDIQLKRNGKVVSRMDLYDLLLRGDNSADARLQSGDVIFIPPIGKTAGIAGQVRRPAIYELKNEKTISDLVSMAGGFSPDAYPQDTKIERILENRERILLDVDITREETKNTELSDGDIVKIYSVLDQLRSVIKLVGQVQRPGDYQWKPGLRLTQIVQTMSDFLPQADPRYLLIKREDKLDHTVTFLDVDLITAMDKPESEANVLLQPRDVIHVFDVRTDREAVIKPLLEQARARSAPNKPAREVVIEGVVHHPGRYPLSSGMKVSDLLRAAGGLTDRAYTLEAELTRFTVVDGKERELTRQNVDIVAALKNEVEKNTELKPYDQLVIQRIPKWGDEGVIEIAGEVRFPGKYPIARNEKLSDVIKRAGGLTDQAYPKGSIFVRESLRQREQEHLERFTEQLERELALFSAQGPEVGVKKETAEIEGQTLLRQLRTTKAAGRMVIKVDALLDGRKDYEVTVQPGDKLYIPHRPQEVTVLGEVHYPTSHLFHDRLDISDYVDLSGGATEKGNKGAIYVVRADGSVGVAGRWFRSDPDPAPGDTIVVPLKVDRVSGLKLFTDISTVIFQLAVTTAALNAVGVF